MLSERNQISNVYHVIPFTRNIHRQIHGDIKQIRGCPGLEAKGVGNDKWVQAFLLGNKNVVESECGDDCTTL